MAQACTTERRIPLLVATNRFPLTMASNASRLRAADDPSMVSEHWLTTRTANITINVGIGHEMTAVGGDADVSALVGECRSLELRCTCDLLRAYLPMTRNTSATSIKHDHLLRWGGQMYYPEKACNDNYVRRRETPSLGGASAPESSSRDDRQEGSTP